MKTSNDVFDQLVIIKLSPSGNHLIAKGLHFADVLGDGEIAFVVNPKGQPCVYGPGLCLRCKTTLDCHLCLGRGGVGADMGENLLGERGQQVAQNLLIHRIQSSCSRLGTKTTFLSAVLISLPPAPILGISVGGGLASPMR
jgi:hypothetical protein